MFLTVVRGRNEGAGITPTETHVIALIGQSNMVGRLGPIDGSLDATDADIFMYRAGTDDIVTAADPLDHFDETADTVGPGLRLAKTYMSNHPEVLRVVLIPAAEGGTGFLARNWNRIDTFYLDVVARIDAGCAKVLADYGAFTFAAICDIQGEDDLDGAEGTEATADEMLGWKTRLYHALRADLADASPTTPIVTGGLPANWTVPTGLSAINTAFGTLPALVEKHGFASSTSPSTLASADTNNIHFTAASAREMGNRMAAAIDSAVASATSIAAQNSAPSPTLSGGTVVLAFDVDGQADDYPIVELTGDIPFSGRRVYVETSQIVFLQSGTPSRRMHFNRSDVPRLGANDFSIKVSVTPTAGGSVTSGQGIIGIWQNTLNRRSWLLDFNPASSKTDVRFFWSTNGTTQAGTLTALASVANGTEYDIEVRRTGSTIELYVDGVLEDSDTISGSLYDYSVDESHGIALGDYNTTYAGGGGARDAAMRVSKFSIEIA